MDSLIACFRSTKDRLTTEAIFHKSNHQTHLPCDSEYKISSPLVDGNIANGSIYSSTVVDGAIANGSILDSIDEMSVTANQLLADVQSDNKKNVGNVCILGTDHIVFDMRNEHKYYFCIIVIHLYMYSRCQFVLA